MNREHFAISHEPACVTYAVPENPMRLVAIEPRSTKACANEVVAALRQDNVALVRRAGPSSADDILELVTLSLDLHDQLVLQAAYASSLGHRSNVGKYFMTVTERGHYRFVPSHSEGYRRVNMQLAAFYCYENSTDGGVTILQNVDSDSGAWSAMYEVITKVDLGVKRLSAPDVAHLKLNYNLNPSEDIVQNDDIVLSERACDISGVKCFNVLSRVRKSSSSILKKDLNVYWDNVGSTDRQSSSEYARLLESCGLLKRPNDETSGVDLDHASHRKAWTSGVAYDRLFKAKLTLKLQPGDLIVQNNFTWTHSASNWTPESGTRRIVAAFA